MFNMHCGVPVVVSLGGIKPGGRAPTQEARLRSFSMPHVTLEAKVSELPTPTFWISHLKVNTITFFSPICGNMPSKTIVSILGFLGPDSFKEVIWGMT